MRSGKFKLMFQKINATLFTGPYEFKPPSFKYDDLALTLNGSEIGTNDQLRYLGVTFNKNLSFIPHINSIISRANYKTFCLRKALSTHNNLSVRAKIICYKQVIRPSITYGFPIWFFISSSQMERLRRLERKALRNCTNISRKPNGHFYSNQFLYGQAMLKPLDEHCYHLSYQYLNRIQFCENPLIMEVANQPVPFEFFDSHKLKPPDYLREYEQISRNPGQSFIPLHHRSYNDPQISVYN
jgi:hypothetical protein